VLQVLLKHSNDIFEVLILYDFTQPVLFSDEIPFDLVFCLVNKQCTLLEGYAISSNRVSCMGLDKVFLLVDREPHDISANHGEGYFSELIHFINDNFSRVVEHRFELLCKSDDQDTKLRLSPSVTSMGNLNFVSVWSMHYSVRLG